MGFKEAMLSDEELDRYARHLVLKEIGGMGQMRLKAAKVALIGMGGLGAPIGLYLAAAGVGTLGLFDPDRVSLSNLQRQIIYATEDLDKPKVEVAAKRLKALNPHSDIHPHFLALEAQTLEAHLRPYDLVVDGTDRFSTRLMINKGVMALGLPLVSAALGRFSGQVSVFQGKPCYQCLVPEVPTEEDHCTTLGIVGALAGIVGSLAALEVIKLITGAGKPLIGDLLIYEGLGAQSRRVKIQADPSCPVCGHKA